MCEGMRESMEMNKQISLLVMVPYTIHVPGLLNECLMVNMLPVMKTNAQKSINLIIN